MPRRAPAADEAVEEAHDGVEETQAGLEEGGDLLLLVRGEVEILGLHAEGDLLDEADVDGGVAVLRVG